MMNKELFQQLKHARGALALTITFGVLGATVMIVQMALLSKAVSLVFLAHAGLGQVASLLLLLPGVIVVRAGLVWGREVAAQQGAIRVKSDLRERLFVRLLQLGPAYSRGERTGELVASLSAGIAQVSDTFRDRTLKMLRIAFLSGAVLEFLTAIAIGLVAVTLGVRLLNGGISFEQAFLVLLLAPEFYRPLRELGVHRHAGMEGNAAAKRIIEILETPVPVHAGVTSPGHPIVHRIVAGSDLAVGLTPPRGVTTFPGGPTA